MKSVWKQINGCKRQNNTKYKMFRIKYTMIIKIKKFCDIAFRFLL